MTKNELNTEYNIKLFKLSNTISALFVDFSIYQNYYMGEAVRFVNSHD